jgi:Ca2+-binding RTX toxin-like protein
MYSSRFRHFANKRRRWFTQKLASLGAEYLELRTLLTMPGMVHPPPPLNSSADLQLLSVSAAGGTEVRVQYQVQGVDVPAFRLGIYQSLNQQKDAGDVLLSSQMISSPQNLSVGIHELTLTAGAGASLPGDGTRADSETDYRLLIVLDDLDTISEPDVHPFNEDNTSPLVGMYQVPGQPLMIFGGDSSDSVLLHHVVDQWQVSFASPGFQSVITVPDVSMRIRAAGGDDIINLADGDSALSSAALIHAGDGDDSVVAGSGNDRVFGGAGNDSLNGLGGNDTVTGGFGDDVYALSIPVEAESDAFVELSGQGTDSLDFSLLPISVTLNLGQTTLQQVHLLRQLTLNQSWTFENVIGGTGDDVLTGNAQGNVLKGMGGNDTLNGYLGSDSLEGGTGDDDYLFGLSELDETDTATESSGAGTDTLNFGAITTDTTLNLGTSALQQAHSGRHLKLNSSASFENAVGGSANDRITGNAGPNRLSGKSGNDTLNGYLGSDMLVGGTGDDRYVFGATGSLAEQDSVIEVANEGTDVLDFGSQTENVSVSLRESLNPPLIQDVHLHRTLVVPERSAIENLIGGLGDDVLIGNGAINTLLGNGGNDRLESQNGDDVLNGGVGNDTLAAGNGNDVLIGGFGDDLYQFTANFASETDTAVEVVDQGLDTLDFSTRLVDVSVNLGTTFPQTVHSRRKLSLNRDDTFENVIGGKAKNNLWGNSLPNLLQGGPNSDTLSGGQGRDLLIGGTGSDVLTGDSDEDLLISGSTRFAPSIEPLTAQLDILSLWNADTPLQDRVAEVSALLLPRTTVIKDTNRNTLNTDADGFTDWLFAASADQINRDLSDILTLF